MAGWRWILVVVLVGCAPTAECVVGDQVRCRCGDGSYGYRTCGSQGADGGVGYGRCDCVFGLSPDAGPVLGSPYMSGRGSGGGGDAGGP
ncbi:MAG: hypothetical protein HY909_24860 [Deltaproteobacteria bacterium]|nr:hypothetical protein [Deltaproteobacteria bacterium]